MGLSINCYHLNHTLLSVLIHFPETVSYNLIDPSNEQEANVVPLGENLTLVIAPE